MAAAAFLPATSLRLTPLSTLRFLSFFPISTPSSSYSLLRPLQRRFLPSLFQASPGSNARRRCFCTAVSESLGSGFGSRVGEFKRKLKIAEVKGGPEEGLGRVGESLTVMGWVRTLRSQSTLTFVEMLRGMIRIGESGSILTGASISVQGTLVASQGTKQKVELKVDKIVVVGKCDSSYPIQKKRVSRELRLIYVRDPILLAR